MTARAGVPLFAEDEVGIGRAAFVGTVIGFVVVTVAVSGIALYVGAKFSDSVAMGVLAGFFGGPGFGGMLGAVMFLARKDERAMAALPQARSRAVDRPARQAVSGY